MLAQWIMGVFVDHGWIMVDYGGSWGFYQDLTVGLATGCPQHIICGRFAE